MTKLYVVFFTFVPFVCFASSGGESYFAYTLKAFGSLLIVLALMFFAMYFLKKINISSRFKSSRISVMDRLYIDNKRYIVIAKIDNKVFALGVGDNINVISELDDYEDKNSD